MNLENLIREYKSRPGFIDGVHFTPLCLVELIDKIINPSTGSVYDPSSGSCSMFFQSPTIRKREREEFFLFGQEISQVSIDFSKDALKSHNLRASIEYSEKGTLLDDRFKGMEFDFILANPPYNQKNWGFEHLKEDPRWIFGTPPKSNANFAWIQHIWSHLKHGGKSAILLPNGVLTTSVKEEVEIRKNMIQSQCISCVISLPEKLFFNTSIPCCMIILEKKKNESIVFVDARSLGKSVSRKQNTLTEDTQKKIATSYERTEDITGFCKIIPISRIEPDFSLSPSRYIDLDKSAGLEDKECFQKKMERLKSDLLNQFDESRKLMERIEENFSRI